jgi:hypothetical protein
VRGCGYSQEKVAQTVNAGWATDPVHPYKHICAKAALNLMEKMANSRPAASGRGTGTSRKRKKSANNSSDSIGSGGRSGGGCSGEGSSAAGRGGGGYGGGGTSGKKSYLSQHWQDMRRWNEPSFQRQEGSGSHHGNREYGSGGGGGAAAERVTARLRTLGSTEAGITAVITAGGAAVTAGTTRVTLKEGWN